MGKLELWYVRFMSAICVVGVFGSAGNPDLFINMWCYIVAGATMFGVLIYDFVRKGGK